MKTYYFPHLDVETFKAEGADFKFLVADVQKEESLVKLFFKAERVSNIVLDKGTSMETLGTLDELTKLGQDGEALNVEWTERQLVVLIVWYSYQPRKKLLGLIRFNARALHSKKAHFTASTVNNSGEVSRPLFVASENLSIPDELKELAGSLDHYFENNYTKEAKVRAGVDPDRAIEYFEKIAS